MNREIEQSLHQVQQKNRAIYVAIAIVSALVFITMGIFLYWTSFPSDVLTIKTKPVPIAKREVTPGDLVVQIYDFCKVTKATGRVEAQLISSISAIPLPPYDD